MKNLLFLLIFFFPQVTFAAGGSCLHHSIETKELTSCSYYQPEFNYSKFNEKACLKHNDREGKRYTKSSWSNKICPTAKLLSVCHASRKSQGHYHKYEHSESEKRHIYGFFCKPERLAETFNNEYYKRVKLKEVVKKKKPKRKPNITAKSEGLDVLLQLNEIRKVAKLMNSYKQSRGKKSMAIAASNTSFGGGKIRKIKKETAQAILTSIENCKNKSKVSFSDKVSNDACPVIQTQKTPSKKEDGYVKFALADKKLIDLFKAYDYECKESKITEKAGNKHMTTNCSVLTKDFGLVKINYKAVRQNPKAEKYQDRKRIETYDITYQEKKVNYVVEYEAIKLSKITLNGFSEKFGYSMQQDKRLNLLPTDVLPIKQGRL